MTEKQKQIARRKRIATVESDHYKEVRKLESQMYAKITRDIKAESKLRKKCEKIIYERLENEHKCDCCRVQYPGVEIGSDGIIYCRIDADHPNDIIDWEEDIDELLKQESSDE